MNKILNNLMKNRKINDIHKSQIQKKIENLIKNQKFKQNLNLYQTHIKDLNLLEQKMQEYRIGIYKDEKEIRRSVARHVGLKID